MDTRSSLLATLVIAITLALSVKGASSQQQSEYNARSGNSISSWLDQGIGRTIKNVYVQCTESEDVFWCFKLNAAKLLGRALKVPNISVLDGVSIITKTENETRTGRASKPEINLGNHELEHLSTKSLDAVLLERFARFMHSRQVQINLPRLLAFGQSNSQDLFKSIFSYLQELSNVYNGLGFTEGRGKKKDKKFLGPFIAAVMLKAAILKMAYHAIAIIAGKALIVGKIALIISAIIGLKKLVGGGGGEKTTYEIVKHPQIQQSHTYSTSHQGEYEGGHEEGSYHRSIENEMLMQDKAYNAWVPAKTS